MRDLKSLLPSPSEHASFVHCPTAWWYRYRAGIRAVAGAARMESGTAASMALEAYYRNLDPLTAYRGHMQKAMEKVEVLDIADWEIQMGLDIAALEFYLTKHEPMEAAWKAILDCQGRIEDQVNLVPDMVVELMNGMVRPIEFKMLSPFADIEYEKKTYEMGMQPISYAKMCEVKYEKVCNSCEMRWLVRPKPAKGRYHSAPASYESHIIWVEPWKKKMWEAAANFANAGMEYVDYIANKEGVEVAEIPKFTHNCIKKLGSMTIQCDYYPACSENMNPMQVVGGFVQKEGKK